ncbi:MAG: hypothetical protein ABII89_05790 [Candidatus Omnitrophota bacterium]
MAITQTAISYYGLNYVEHAEKDFQEMLEHGCTTVILAVTEFDADFWFPSIPKIVNKARKLGLRVLLDPWGIGKYFGGEQVSLFLQNNTENRQVSAFTGEKLPHACFNTQSFRDYFQRICLKLAGETAADGFFWDEPHYALSNTGTDDWTCRCPVCMKKFFDYYGYEMPKMMNDDVKQFRWREALFILEDTSRKIKGINPKSEITCCVLATPSNYYVTEYRGYDNWDLVAASPYFDVFATSILGWDMPESLFEHITKRTVDIAKKYGKKSERWIMNYYQQPHDFAQVDRLVNLYEKLGVDRIGAWTYRGGYGTVLAAPDALKLWDRLGENYKRVLKK